MKKRLGGALRGLLLAALLLLCLGFFLFLWAQDNFGNVTMEQLIFLLCVPMEGVSASMLWDCLWRVLLPGVGIWGAFLLLSHYPKSRAILLSLRWEEKEVHYPLLPLSISSKPLAFLLLVGYAGLLLRVGMAYQLPSYLRSALDSSALIQEEYVSPGQVAVTFPRERKNLLWIVLESGESSAQDLENGGLMGVNYIPELTLLARENLSFSRSEKLEGAACPPGCGWTMAGLVAQTAGVPLLTPESWNNVMSRYDSFLPGVTSLGDLLKEAGYHNYFLAGSDFTFGGRRAYFTQHGSFTIYDYLWAKGTGRIPKDYKEFWGFEDEKLFAYARELLTGLSGEQSPFCLMLLTVDTHTPNGYVCPLCRQDFPSQYGNVWACSSRQVGSFVEWVREQPFYEDTVVVITGDHLSMNPSFYGGNTTDAYPGEARRRVYNCFLNAGREPVREKGRTFTTLDFFPTVLSSLGVTIEGERLGLGTNLFSDRDTLAEELGLPYLYGELSRRSRFYEEELLYAQVK